MFAPTLRQVSRSCALVSRRKLHQSSKLRAASDPLDKDTINTESREYSKTGGDGAATGTTENAAFSPDRTRPESQYSEAEKESGKKGVPNPLNVSPANHEVSQARDPKEGGHEGSAAASEQGDRRRTSGKGSSPKQGTGKPGGGK